MCLRGSSESWWKMHIIKKTAGILRFFFNPNQLLFWFCLFPTDGVRCPCATGCQSPSSRKRHLEWKVLDKSRAGTQLIWVKGGVAATGAQLTCLRALKTISMASGYGGWSWDKAPVTQSSPQDWDRRAVAPTISISFFLVLFSNCTAGRGLSL